MAEFRMPSLGADMEAGTLVEWLVKPGDKVKAVVTWIIPDHLSRVTGDGGWLGASPRYVLEDGKPVDYRSEPAVTFMQELKVDMLSLLPIDELL